MCIHLSQKKVQTANLTSVILKFTRNLGWERLVVVSYSHCIYCSRSVHKITGKGGGGFSRKVVGIWGLSVLCISYCYLIWNLASSGIDGTRFQMKIFCSFLVCLAVFVSQISLPACLPYLFIHSLPLHVCVLVSTCILCFSIRLFVVCKDIYSWITNLGILFSFFQRWVRQGSVSSHDLFSLYSVNIMRCIKNVKEIKTGPSKAKVICRNLWIISLKRTVIEA